jgi:hypothetical protein
MENNSDHIRANSNMGSIGLANQIIGETMDPELLTHDDILGLINIDLDDFQTSLLDLSGLSSADKNSTRSDETNESNKSIQMFQDNTKNELESLPREEFEILDDILLKGILQDIDLSENDQPLSSFETTSNSLGQSEESNELTSMVSLTRKEDQDALRVSSNQIKDKIMNRKEDEINLPLSLLTSTLPSVEENEKIMKKVLKNKRSLETKTLNKRFKKGMDA